MITGVVTAVDRRWSGGTLSADVTSTATVLPVDDAGDFDEEFAEPRYLVIGEETTPREYVAVENDESLPNTVTLAAAVGATFEAGLPVVLWDPESSAIDKRAVEWSATVLLDDSEDGSPIPATIPHEQIPLAGPYSLVGARVSLAEEDEDDWYVSQVIGREPTIDPSYVDTPAVTRVLGADLAIPHDTETTVGPWLYLVAGAWVNSGSNQYVAPRDGNYLVTFGTKWVLNSTGRRECWFRTTTAAGTTDHWRDTRPAAGIAGLSTLAVGTVALREGETVEFRVLQTSGASLTLRGGTDGDTAFSITWIGDL